VQVNDLRTPPQALVALIEPERSEDKARLLLLDLPSFEILMLKMRPVCKHHSLSAPCHRMIGCNVLQPIIPRVVFCKPL
jgi:hypothetical protein